MTLWCLFTFLWRTNGNTLPTLMLIWKKRYLYWLASSSLHHVKTHFFTICIASLNKFDCLWGIKKQFTMSIKHNWISRDEIIAIYTFMMTCLWKRPFIESIMILMWFKFPMLVPLSIKQEFRGLWLLPTSSPLSHFGWRQRLNERIVKLKAQWLQKIRRSSRVFCMGAAKTSKMDQNWSGFCEMVHHQ
jgi:hypothetical protein